MTGSNFSLLKDKFTCALDSEFTDLKFIGQEKDCGLLTSWNDEKNETNLGLFYENKPSVQIFFSFHKSVNVVHASYSCNSNLLVYSIKSPTNSENEEEQYYYDVFMRYLGNDDGKDKHVVVQSYRQVMAQFLASKVTCQYQRLLILSHQNTITLYQVKVTEETHDIGSEIELVVEEVIVEEFPWAQMDSNNQILYYIHFRKKSGDQSQQYLCVTSQEDNLAPTLSALQFNLDTPHESVLNIPVNLPLVMFDSPSYLYNDDPIPLRIHDSSLNVYVLTSHIGIIAICYHYIFQPVIGPYINRSEQDENICVHFAYSVTLLHQARVIHCTVPSVPYSIASQIQPTYALHKNEFMIVSLPGILVHLLDVDPSQCGPNCHIVLPPASDTNHTLSIRRQPDRTIYVNPETHQVLDLKINSDKIRRSYNSDRSSLLNNLSVLHYFLAHEDNIDAISDVLHTIGEDCLSSSLQKLFNELLVGGTFSWVSKVVHHPSGGATDDKLATLTGLLPITTLLNTSTSTFTIKRDEWMLRVVQEELLNPGVMLLTRQQRLCPYRNDLWTRLLDLIPNNKSQTRFRPSTVADKLMVSLICYQPEALSKCSTPLSPGIGLLSTFGLFDMGKLGRIRSQLPFHEIEKCTASKQEHIISVNLRELSMHLVKYSNETGININTIATRYASSQMEMSKYLCALTTKSAGVRVHHTKGFQLIDSLCQGKRRLLFHLLERVIVSADSLAFPLPPGFHSFSSYLGFRVLPFHIFIQYVEANVLQLQIDVVKIIIKEIDASEDGTQRKLQLLSLAAKSRAKRLLEHCSEPISLVLRAREHTSNILSGMENQCNARRPLKIKSCGLKTFCSSDRQSPLETFLNLLTAKASLAELDFNLLAEATTASIGL